VGVGTPKSRDEMGEGGDDFYIARSGRCVDLLSPWGGGGGQLRYIADEWKAALRREVT